MKYLALAFALSLITASAANFPSVNVTGTVRVGPLDTNAIASQVAVSVTGAKPALETLSFLSGDTTYIATTYTNGVINYGYTQTGDPLTYSHIYIGPATNAWPYSPEDGVTHPDAALTWATDASGNTVGGTTLTLTDFYSPSVGQNFVQDTLDNYPHWENDPFVYGQGMTEFKSILGDTDPTMTNRLDPGTSYFAFVTQRGGGQSAASNEMQFAVWSDGIRPAGLMARTDGYDGTAGIGNPMRWGINTETPAANLEIVNSYVGQSYPIQNWKKRVSNVETTMGSMSVAGLMTTAGGFGSSATDSATPIAATGWTNTFDKNAVVYVNGTAATYTIANNAGTLVRTNSVAAGATSTAILQPNGKLIITAGTGISGSAVPF